MNSLLLLFALLMPGQENLSEQVDAATRRGVEYLLPRQYADGSWKMAGQERFTGGTTALACYALYKAGLPKKHSAIQLSLEYLRTNTPIYTYDAALRILLLTSLDSAYYSERISRAAEVLTYGPTQYFTYAADTGRGATGDMSNHQYGLVGLEALDRHGFETSEKAWIKTTEFMIRQAAPGGGWGYFPNQDSTATMDLAGLAGGACCKLALERMGGHSGLRRQLDKVLEAALLKAEGEWFLDQPMEKAPLNRWFFYACYGVERAMALLGLEQLGELDWYPLIAREILRRQRKNGSWSSAKGEPEMNTAFALLTLARATASTGSAQVEQATWEHRWVSNLEHSPIQITAAGAPQCAVFLSSFSADWIADQSWDGEQRPRVHRVEWLLDGKSVSDQRLPLATVIQASNGPAPQRFAEKISVEHNGEFELVARLHFQAPGDDEGELSVVESSPLLLQVNGLVDSQVTQEIAYRKKHAFGGRPNLGQFKIETSSSIGGAAGGFYALDRCQGTAWRWQKNDTERTFVVEFDKPQRIKAIRFLPALPADQSLDYYQMPTLLELKVNGTRGKKLALEAKNWRDGLIFPFHKSQKIRKIVVKVISVQAGRRSGIGGFREIELLNE